LRMPSSPSRRRNAREVNASSSAQPVVSRVQQSIAALR
jgi:hypothetical protein